MTKITTAREASNIFEILGIKDITTKRQRRNGTTVYELPIQRMWQTLNPKPLRFATYSTGYVRNVSEDNSSPYQINKTRQVPCYKGYRREVYTERILIPTQQDRLIYLANFVIKNYYQKPTYLMNDHVIKCLKEAYVRDYNNKPNIPPAIHRLPFHDLVDPESTPVDDIQVVVNGHRYNIC